MFSLGLSILFALKNKDATTLSNSFRGLDSGLHMFVRVFHAVCRDRRCCGSPIDLLLDCDVDKGLVAILLPLFPALNSLSTEFGLL